jgi:hypothetical protein
MKTPTYQQLAEAEIRGIIQDRQPLEVERLLTENQRRLTVEDHQAWRESTFPAAHHVDEIDLAVDAPGPARTRSQREVSRLLSILDEIGKDGSK